jgi:hypothetical protein
MRFGLFGSAQADGSDLGAGIGQDFHDYIDSTSRPNPSVITAPSWSSTISTYRTGRIAMIIIPPISRQFHGFRTQTPFSKDESAKTG